MIFTFSIPEARAAQQAHCQHLPLGAVYWTTYFGGTNLSRYNPATGVARIAAGSRVYLNESPNIDIALLIVEGSLVFDHCFDDLELAAASILVIGNGVAGNGVLQIGKSDVRFPHDATIRLRDWPNPNSIPSAAWSTYDTEIQGALADRGLVVCNGGTLHLYGKDRGESWTKLAQTAAGGATALTTVTSALPWGDGDEIVIASTDFEQAQAETRFLKTPVAGGQLEFNTGLAHQHWGIVQNFDPTPPTGGDLWLVDERAEVGLLNRNVEIVGEQSTYSPSDPENFGHVFLYRGDQAAPPKVEISWAEFRDLGIAGATGRYPLHFHMLKDPGSITNFVEYSSIRQGHNRGLVLHDSQSIRAQGNVVYDVVGYGVYIEDKDTMNCEILDNLSLFNRKLEHNGPNPLIDPDPSNFAFRSPDNTVQGNVAAGSTAYGIYLDLYNGLFEMVVNEEPIFSGNSAHSCQRIGIFLDQEFEPELTFTFADSRVWKCREYGMWIRSVRDYLVTGLVAADCRSGFYPASKGLRESGEGHQLITNGLFVGETANWGAPNLLKDWETDAGRSLPQDEPDLYANEPNEHELKWDTLNGIEIYDGLIEITNCRFAEFQDLVMPGTGEEDYRRAAGLTQVAKVTTWSNDPRNRVANLLFGNNVDRTVHFRTTEPGNNQVAFTLIVDTDNSLDYGANVMLMPNTPFLTSFQPSATFYADAVLAPGLNGYAVPLSAAAYGQLAVRLNTAGWLPSTLARTAWRRIQDPGGAQVVPLDSWSAATVPTNPNAGGDNAFVFPVCVEVGDAALPPADVCYYRMTYPDYGISSFPPNLTVMYRFAPDVNKTVFLEIPYDSGQAIGGAPSEVFYFDVLGQPIGIFSKADLGSLLATTDPQAWTYSSVNQVIYLKLTSLVRQGQSLYPDGTQTIMGIER